MTSDTPTKVITEALNKCLRDIEEGKGTMETCLEQFPDLADELGPLLLAAKVFRQSSRPSLSAQQLVALQGKLTTQLRLWREKITFDTDVEVKKFVRLPARETQPPERRLKKPWRLILVSSNSKHKPLGLELHDDIVLGRRSQDVVIDLDLSEYEGKELGLSRLHALIHAYSEGLQIFDLASTNGTYRNHDKLSPGVAYDLESGDIVSFANLHFKLKVVQSPPDAKHSTKDA